MGNLTANLSEYGNFHVAETVFSIMNAAEQHNPVAAQSGGEAENRAETLRPSFQESAVHDVFDAAAEREAQARLFDAALSSMADFAYVFDKESRFTYVNQALLDLWQIKSAEAIGKNFTDLRYPPELAARLHQQVQAVFDTGKILRDETPYTGASGTPGYYEYIFAPVLSKEGQVEFVVGSTRDITQRHKEQIEKAELVKKLQVERERLASLFTQAPAFIAVLRGPLHIYEMANPPYYQIVGHRALIGKPVREAFPEVEGQGFFEILDRVYETGEPFVGKDSQILLEFTTDDVPQMRYMDIVYQPLVEADGAISGILVHGVDLTERKRAERALRVSEESLSLAVDAARLGTFYCEAPLDVIIWNATCKEHFFLLHDAEVDFDLFYSLLHPEDREPTRQMIEFCMRERSQYNVEYRVVAPDGRMRWINAIGQGYYTETGDLERFDGITIDISEKKAREGSLKLLVTINDATRQMQEPEAIMLTAARLLGEFMAVSRCAYAPVEADEIHFTIYEDYTNGCASSAGRYELTAFGPRAVAELRAGRAYVLNDRNREATPDDNLAAFEALGIEAIICTPHIKEGKLVALMAVHQTTPRLWTADEIKLVEMVAERSRAIIERAYADRRLTERADEIEALNTRLRLAMKETHHRVKNNLQVISAMIEMQMMEHQGEQTIPLEEFERLQAHVHTLAVTHDLLTNSHREEEADERISTRAVLERLLPMLQQTAWKQNVRYAVDDAELTSKQCVALSLLINELVSNALKHGRSEAEVHFTVDKNEAMLVVCDDGNGFPADFDPRKAANTGLELARSLTQIDLRGRMQFGNQSGGGGRVVVTFPLPPNLP